MRDESIFEVPRNSERLPSVFSADFFFWQALSDFFLSQLARALILIRPFV